MYGLIGRTEGGTGRKSPFALSYKVPFVEGTPSARGSRVTAIRNARAKALNTVSAW